MTLLGAFLVRTRSVRRTASTVAVAKLSVPSLSGSFAPTKARLVYCPLVVGAVATICTVLDALLLRLPRSHFTAVTVPLDPLVEVETESQPLCDL